MNPIDTLLNFFAKETKLTQTPSVVLCVNLFSVLLLLLNSIFFGFSILTFFLFLFSIILFYGLILRFTTKSNVEDL